MLFQINFFRTILRTVATLSLAGMTASAFGQTILVSYAGNATVEKFSLTGSDLGTFANGFQGLNNPAGIAVDSSGNVYVANSLDSGLGSISKFSSTGTSLGTFASGLSLPTGIALDTAGNVFVASAATHQVSKFSSS